MKVFEKIKDEPELRELCPYYSINHVLTTLSSISSSKTLFP